MNHPNQEHFTYLSFFQRQFAFHGFQQLLKLFLLAFLVWRYSWKIAILLELSRISFYGWGQAQLPIFENSSMSAINITAIGPSVELLKSDSQSCSLFIDIKALPEKTKINFLKSNREFNLHWKFTVFIFIQGQSQAKAKKWINKILWRQSTRQVHQSQISAKVILNLCNKFHNSGSNKIFWDWNFTLTNGQIFKRS